MATPSKAKKVMFTALAALGVTVGAAGVASAATSQATPSAPAAAEHQSGVDTPEPGDSPDYTSSVTVSQTPDSGAETDNEAADAAKLAPLATVTPEAASAAATAAVPGTAGAATLGDENGNVVYEVGVTTTDGSKVEVKVDAGNGNVLAQETGDAGEEKGADKGEGPEGTESGSETPDGTTSN